MTLAFAPGKICVCWLRYVAGRRRHKAIAKMQANVIQISPFCLECPSNGAADAGTASAGSVTFERSESLAICRSRISPGNTFVRWLDGSDASSRAVGFALHCGQVTPESFSVSPHFWQNAELLAVRRSFVLGIVDAPVKRFSIEMLSVAEQHARSMHWVSRQDFTAPLENWLTLYVQNGSVAVRQDGKENAIC